MRDIDNVDFEKLIQDLKSVDCSEFIKLAKEILGDNYDETMLTSIARSAAMAFVSKQSDCIDAEKLIVAVDNIDPSVMKNLKFKITGALNAVY